MGRQPNGFQFHRKARRHAGGLAEIGVPDPLPGIPQLRELGVTTYLIHASLSLGERRQAERAFAEGRDCVLVPPSALELSVAAFLRRLGRSGRRPGTTRNCLFLALGEDELLLAAGLLLACSRGFVEPVVAPPEPMHITAQQLLALCLREGQVGERTWPEWLPLPALTAAAQPITRYLIELATAALAARLADLDHAASVLAEPVRFERSA